MSALKLYFIVVTNNQTEKIITVRELDSCYQLWDRQPNSNKTIIIHCAFTRPRVDLQIELPESTQGKVLYSGSMKWALPEKYKSSESAIAHIRLNETITPCYFALNQWGYDIDELEIAPEIEEVNADEQGNDPILQCPLDSLKLSVRANNGLKANGIFYIGELVQRTELELFKMRNMGKLSIDLIKNALATHDLSLGTKLENQKFHGSSGFQKGTIDKNDLNQLVEVPMIKHLENSLSELKEVDRIVLQNRLGYKGKVLTLEEIGEKINVTRERVRQRQKKSINRIIAQGYWDDRISIRIGQLLLDREKPLILELLDIEDEWFKGFGDNYIYLANVVQIFSKNAVRVIKVPGRHVVTRIKQNEWDKLVRELRAKLKRKAKEKKWSRSDIRQYLETSLFEYNSQELAPLLHEVFDEFLHYQNESEQSILIAFGKSVESVVTKVLAQSEEPLHFTEVAKRASEQLGRQVDERRAHSALYQDHIWLFDRGTYGLIKHCSIPASKRTSIRIEVENILYQAPINKQWHSKEIINHLTAKFSSKLEELDPYVLRMCIEHSPKITFLNRMVWVRADSGMKVGDRIETAVSFIQLLEEAGEPLTGQELRQRLSEIRGVSENMQIHGNERLVAFGPNLWGLSDW